MKLKNVMFLMLIFFLLSMSTNLYFNMKINVLSGDLEQIRNEIIQLEIEKSKVHLKHTEQFSIGNIEKLSKEINFKRLDIHNKNYDLVRPYKLMEDTKPIIVLGFGK
tara:strand:- start:889 stop:1209 length:321 start_codon:yes stop_codon:yes gene_type:complete